MNKRHIWFYSSLSVTVITLVLLVTGSSVLTIALDKNDSVPLGTFITWAGMTALPLTIYWGIKDLRTPSDTWTSMLSILLKIIIVLAILWVPISFLLAGNISFSFSEKETFQGGQAAMRWFWRLSYGIGIGAVSTIMLYGIGYLFRRK